MLVKKIALLTPLMILCMRATTEHEFLNKVASLGIYDWNKQVMLASAVTQPKTHWFFDSEDTVYKVTPCTRFLTQEEQDAIHHNLLEMRGKRPAVYKRLKGLHLWAAIGAQTALKNSPLHRIAHEEQSLIAAFLTRLAPVLNVLGYWNNYLIENIEHAQVIGRIFATIDTEDSVVIAKPVKQEAKRRAASPARRSARIAAQK